MKKILFIAFLALTVTVSAQTGYVDTDYLIANMPEVKVADEEIKTFTKELQSELTSADATATSQFKNLQEQAQGTEITEEQRAVLASKADDLQKGLQRAQKLAEIRLNTERNKVMAPIYEKMNAAIKKVAKDRGFKIVVSVNTVLYAEESLDITKLVQTELGFNTNKRTDKKAA